MLRDYSENELTIKVRKYLIEKHCVEYTGKFYTTLGTLEDNPGFYSLEWLANQQDRPMVMLGDFDSLDDFYKFVCKEIDTRSFHRKKIFILKRTDKNGNT